MIRAIIYGCNGKMGQVLSQQILEQEDFQIAAGIDRENEKYGNPYPTYSNPNEFNGEADVIIDFSHPSYLDQMLDFALDRKLPMVIATTGFSEEELNKIKMASEEIPILHSYNMSLGVNLLSSVLKQISGLLADNFDIEIIEKHHNKKVDAPSGTAYLLANKINEGLKEKLDFNYGRQGKTAKRGEKEIGIHAVRGGTIPGEHTVIFAGLDEIIEFKHTALSKNIFAQGAIGAARFMAGKEKGFYTMADIFNM